VTRRGGRRSSAFAVLLVALTVTGCSANTSARSGPTMIASGQIPGSVTFEGGGGTGKQAGTTGTTIPLAKQSPTTSLFSAISAFQSCLKGRGVTFQGAPNPNDPNSPANDPSYVKTLATCAAQSKIVQALQTEQSAQNNLTPKQVAAENRGYLKWRACMIKRGWQIPVPTPNAKGLLFSFGGGGGGGGGITPPPGQSLSTSADTRECAAQAQGSKS